MSEILPLESTGADAPASSVTSSQEESSSPPSSLLEYEHHKANPQMTQDLDPIFKAEYAKSGRSQFAIVHNQCAVCKNNIKADSLRLGVEIWEPHGSFRLLKWNHPKCFLLHEYFTYFVSIDCLEGVDDLFPEHRELLVQLLLEKKFPGGSFSFSRDPSSSPDDAVSRPSRRGRAKGTATRSAKAPAATRTTRSTRAAAAAAKRDADSGTENTLEEEEQDDVVAKTNRRPAATAPRTRKAPARTTTKSAPAVAPRTRSTRAAATRVSYREIDDEEEYIDQSESDSDETEGEDDDPYGYSGSDASLSSSGYDLSGYSESYSSPRSDFVSNSQSLRSSTSIRAFSSQFLHFDPPDPLRLPSSGDLLLLSSTPLFPYHCSKPPNFTTHSREEFYSYYQGNHGFFLGASRPLISPPFPSKADVPHTQSQTNVQAAYSSGSSQTSSVSSSSSPSSARTSQPTSSSPPRVAHPALPSGSFAMAPSRFASTTDVSMTPASAPQSISAAAPSLSTNLEYGAVVDVSSSKTYTMSMSEYGAVIGAEIHCEEDESNPRRTLQFDDLSSTSSGDFSISAKAESFALEVSFDASVSLPTSYSQPEDGILNPSNYSHQMDDDSLLSLNESYGGESRSLELSSGVDASCADGYTRVNPLELSSTDDADQPPNDIPPSNRRSSFTLPASVNSKSPNGSFSMGASDSSFTLETHTSFSLELPRDSSSLNQHSRDSKIVSHTPSGQDFSLDSSVGYQNVVSIAGPGEGSSSPPSLEQRKGNSLPPKSSRSSFNFSSPPSNFKLDPASPSLSTASSTSSSTSSPAASNFPLHSSSLSQSSAPRLPSNPETPLSSSTLSPSPSSSTQSLQLAIIPLEAPESEANEDLRFSFSSSSTSTPAPTFPVPPPSSTSWSFSNVVQSAASPQQSAGSTSSFSIPFVPTPNTHSTSPFSAPTLPLNSNAMHGVNPFLASLPDPFNQAMHMNSAVPSPHVNSSPMMFNPNTFHHPPMATNPAILSNSPFNNPGNNAMMMNSQLAMLLSNPATAANPALYYSLLQQYHANNLIAMSATMNMNTTMNMNPMMSPPTHAMGGHQFPLSSSAPLPPFTTFSTPPSSSMSFSIQSSQGMTSPTNSSSSFGFGGGSAFPPK